MSERNDATTPPPDDRPTSGAETPDAVGDSAGDGAAPGPPADPARRRRRLIIGGVITLAVLLVLLGCVAVATLVRSGVRIAERVDDGGQRYARLSESCLELETRLNRLTPPGATAGDPRRRARAIRDENTALRPFLTEVESLNAARDEDWDGFRHGFDGDWTSGWRQLVEARTAYADALERQAASGEPAFFLPPQAPDGDDVVDLLERRGPDSCEGSVRRLGHPDL